MHVHVCKKDNIFRQRRLNHSEEEFMVKMPCQSYHIQRLYVSLFFLLTLIQTRFVGPKNFHCMLPSPLCGIFSLVSLKSVCFNGVSRKFQGCFKEVSRAFRGCVKVF